VPRTDSTGLFEFTFMPAFCRACLPALLLAAFASPLAAENPPPAAAIAGLDHIPIAVRDLGKAADDFRRIGFALKPGPVPENGSKNVHAKFRDGTELELITAPEARDGLTTTYVRHLSAGDGPAFLALFAPDSTALVGRLSIAKQSFEDDHGFISLTEPAEMR